MFLYANVTGIVMQGLGGRDTLAPQEKGLTMKASSKQSP